jgi:hypothetical protein
MPRPSDDELRTWSRLKARVRADAVRNFGLTTHAGGRCLRLDLVERLDRAWLVVRVSVCAADAVPLAEQLVKLGELALPALILDGGEQVVRVSLPLALGAGQLAVAISLCLATAAALAPARPTPTIDPASLFSHT